MGIAVMHASAVCQVCYEENATNPIHLVERATRHSVCPNDQGRMAPCLHLPRPPLSNFSMPLPNQGKASILGSLLLLSEGFEAILVNN